MASSHKRQTLYLLRYIRVREFRKRLLDIMNFYRSLERRLCIDAQGFALPSDIRRQHKRTGGHGRASSTTGSPVSPLKATMQDSVWGSDDTNGEFDNADGDTFTEHGRDSYTQVVVHACVCVCKELVGGACVLAGRAVQFLETACRFDGTGR